MNKKSQSLLVSFSVHLVGIMVFFIVLIALMSMTHNVRYTISEFDEKTAAVLVDRRLTSSADCLAYESRYVTVEPNSGVILSADRVYPNIIDIRKLNDFEHVNCMRKDMYDLKEDVRQGVWDASKGHGAAQKYDLIPISTANGFTFMKNPDGSTFKSHIITSLLSRVQKKLYNYALPYTDTQTDNSHSIMACGSPLTTETIDIGGYYMDCQTSKFCYASCENYMSNNPDSRFIVGTCKGSPTQFYYDNSPKNFYLGACVIKENKTSPQGVNPLWVYNPSYYVFYNTVAADTKKPNYQIGIWNQENTTCSDYDSSDRVTLPVSFYDNGKLINGALIIDTCVLKGEQHKGLSLPEIIYKPQYHKR